MSARESAGRSGSTDRETADNNARPDSTARSTATADQERRIVDALRDGPRTTDELRALGIFQVAARVFGLRKRGYEIFASLVDETDAYGYRHRRMARYALISEPQCEQMALGLRRARKPLSGRSGASAGAR